jgi:hypothetical protein
MDLRMFDEGGKLCKVLLVSSTFNIVLGTSVVNPRLFSVKDLSKEHSRWSFIDKATLETMTEYKKRYV